MNCIATNASGEPCGITIGIDADGFCQAHREGGRERLREAASKGGKATTSKHSEGFRAGELPALTDHASVKQSIEAAMRAAAERRITHHEFVAHMKACETWLKVDSAQITKQLVNDTQKELERAKREIESLRRQLADRARGFKTGPTAVAS